MKTIIFITQNDRCAGCQNSESVKSVVKEQNNKAFLLNLPQHSAGNQNKMSKDIQGQEFRHMIHTARIWG